MEVKGGLAKWGFKSFHLTGAGENGKMIMKTNCIEHAWLPLSRLKLIQIPIQLGLANSTITYIPIRLSMSTCHIPCGSPYRKLTRFIRNLHFLSGPQNLLSAPQSSQVWCSWKVLHWGKAHRRLDRQHHALHQPRYPAGKTRHL